MKNKGKEKMKSIDSYQICNNCIMDTSDPQISFDNKGQCDFCDNFYNTIMPNWHVDENSFNELKKIAAKIKKDTVNNKYNCIIGMSGGVDSSYLCYVAKEIMGLNPLVYSVDTGWNLNLAVENIKKVVTSLDVDSYIEVVDWNEMKDLQLAFLKSQVPYQDTPQDHAIFAGLYNYAAKNNIKYVLTGGNYSTECVKPPYEWTYINDLRMINDIHNKFGSIKLLTMPKCGMLKNRIYYRYIKKMKVIKPLDYVPFDKTATISFLKEKFNWVEYENKHYENVFTRFFEGYYLPKKFGYDKRRCYLSSLILTKQITREEALDEIQKAPYDEVRIKEDMKYIADKLGLTVDSFKIIMEGENKTFRDYKNSFAILRIFIKIAVLLGLEKRNFR